MLIGIPGSGKSTWIKNTPIENSVVVSTDNLIEAEAQRLNMTYDEVFHMYIKTASQKINHDVLTAVKNEKNIIWDQTNITKKGRSSKLAKIPSDYRKVAIVFPILDAEVLEQRLSQREGKTIPDHIVASMIKHFQIPDLTEFDEIIEVKQTN